MMFGAFRRFTRCGLLGDDSAAGGGGVTFFLQLAGAAGYLMLADGTSHISLAGH